MELHAVRRSLIKAGASETVFQAVNRQLSRHDYMAHGRQMIDASIVQAPNSRSRKTNDIVAEQAIPAGWWPAKRR